MSSQQHAAGGGTTRSGSVGREHSGSGYRGKWKKWLLLYLGIGAVVYAIVYFVFLHHSGGAGGGGGGGGYAFLALRQAWHGSRAERAGVAG